jgi:uncharacterized membrane-anchored protein YhcB (DUF1043 family)
MEIMETWVTVWLIIGAVVTFGAGLCIGLYLGRTRQSGATRREAEELKGALRQSQEELRHYQAQVTHHFTQTADLLQTLTADYRAVYEHLAAGAQALCDGQVTALTAEALREHLLPAPSHGGAHAEGSASQPVSALPEEQRPLTEESYALKPDMASASVHRDTEDTRAREGLSQSSREGRQ